jgi:ketopantoate reductase
MEHAVLGADAIGGLVATALADESEQVTLLVRPHTHTDRTARRSSVELWQWRA